MKFQVKQYKFPQGHAGWSCVEFDYVYEDIGVKELTLKKGVCLIGDITIDVISTISITKECIKFLGYESDSKTHSKYCLYPIEKN